MSAHDKLKGGQESELTRFKKLWRDSLSESAREYWRELFVSDTSQTEIRAQLLTKLKVRLDYDKQLNQFRDWELDQRERDLQAERMNENERRLIAEHPDWTRERVREEVLRQSYFETLATGNFKLGLKAVAADARLEALQFDKEKFKESVRTKLETALAALAEHIKGNPKAKAAYEAFRAAISETTK